MIEISAPVNVLHKAVGLSNVIVVGAITWAAEGWFLV